MNAVVWIKEVSDRIRFSPLQLVKFEMRLLERVKRAISWDKTIVSRKVIYLFLLFSLFGSIS